MLHGVNRSRSQSEDSDKFRPTKDVSGSDESDAELIPPPSTPDSSPPDSSASDSATEAEEQKCEELKAPKRIPTVNQNKGFSNVKSKFSAFTAAVIAFRTLAWRLVNARRKNGSTASVMNLLRTYLR